MNYDKKQNTITMGIFVESDSTKMPIVRISRSVFLPISVFAFLFFFFGCGTADAALTQKPPTNLGLVGYWSFDEGTSTLAGDSSGYGQTATTKCMGASCVNPTWVNNGKRGKAMLFSGTSGDAGPGSMVQAQMKGPITKMTSATWSAWVNSNSVSSDQMFITSNSSVANYFRLNGSKLFLSIANPAQRSFAGNATLKSNTWYHAVATYDGATGVANLYLNGVLDNTTTFTAGNLDYRAGNINIGSWYAVSIRPFKGMLDDIRIYNRVLSPSEILTLYRSGEVVKKQANNLGLVGSWNFDEGTSTSAGDSSGNKRTGILYPGSAGTNTSTSTMWTNGKHGKAINFDGNDDVVNTGADYLGTGALTISAWIMPNSAGGASIGRIVDNGKRRLVMDVNNRVAFHNDSASTVYSTNTSIKYGNNIWQHVVVTSDAAGLANFYINGVLNNTANQNAGTPTAGSQNVMIGNNAVSTGIRGFDGKLDDVRIYNRALSATEVAALYKTGEVAVNSNNVLRLTSGLVGYWSFNGPDITTVVADTSGQGNNGYIYNVATSSAKTIGKMGQGLQFDGVNDYVSPSNNINITGAVTLSAWVRPNKFSSSGNSFDVIVNNYDGSSSGRLLLDLGSADGHIRFRGTSAPGFTLDEASIVSSWNTNRDWYHVVGTFDGTNASVYVNGVLKETVAGSNDASNIKWYIGGRDPAQTAVYFKGSIDELRIYNRALTAAEVKQLYLMGK